MTISDKTAFFAVKCVRLVFDTGERADRSLLGDVSSGFALLTKWDGSDDATYAFYFFLRPPPHISDTPWNFGSITKEKILNHDIFLETIAAIPGMVAAIICMSLFSFLCSDVAARCLAYHPPFYFLPSPRKALPLVAQYVLQRRHAQHVP